MKHAREDYNRIIDPLGKIPEDEPVFLIRGHDKLGPSILRMYAEINFLMGGNRDISHRVREWALEMEAWQAKTGKKKLADIA